ncbi:MAG: sulfatase-like hydrolase/transferase [Myxococcales bacterium]|nr:sulfatase-like hydrolase/transferase [Myxococcales bacterium]
MSTQRLRKDRLLLVFAVFTLVVGACKDDEPAKIEPTAEIRELPTEHHETPPTTPATELPTEPSNVLVVVLDDIAVHNTSTYTPDSEAASTPTLSALADEGMLFRNAWSMPMCSATRASLVTGRYPNRTGVGSAVEFFNLKAVRPLDPEEITLPEMLSLSKQNWDTSLVGKWHLTPYEDDVSDPQQVLVHPGEQGFAWYGATVGNVDDYSLWEKNTNGATSFKNTYVTTDSANDALERIEVMAEPWLLSLNFHAPHSPMHSPPQELVPGNFSTEIEKYNAMITAADVELGRVLDEMDPAVRARTTIMVLGDNGTPWEVTSYSEGRFKASAFEQGVNVPFVVAGPYVEQPGTQTDALVNVVDLFPTIAQIAGVDLGVLGVPIDGVSFLPVLEDPLNRVRDTMYTEIFFLPDGLYKPGTTTYALRDERFKLLVRDGWDYTAWDLSPDAIELYDLQNDPNELIDLSNDPSYAADFDRLQTELEDLRTDLGAE